MIQKSQLVLYLFVFTATIIRKSLYTLGKLLWLKFRTIFPQISPNNKFKKLNYEINNINIIQ